MAITLIESFDWLDVGMNATQITAALITRKGGSGNVTSTDAEVVLGMGGKGSALRLKEVDQFVEFPLAVTSVATDEIGMGGWFRYARGTTTNSIPQTRDLFGLYDTAGRYVMNVRLLDGQVCLYRNTTFIAYSGFTPGIDQWHWIEYVTVVNDTTGSYELKIDGVSYLSATGVDTRDAGNGVVDACRIACPANGSDSYDCGGFICWDDNTGNLVDFPGPCSFIALHPDADGDDELWTTSSGTDSFVLINETAPHDDDSDYLEDSTSTNRSLFTYDDLDTDLTGVHGIQINTVLRETDGTDFTFIHAFKQNSIDYPESSQAIAGQTYESLLNILDLDPDTSSAWTVSGVNSVQAGIETG
jgi:hypothetical protein